MENDIKRIQKNLMDNLERLNKEKKNINEEVARSNAISQLANTYIKSCNLIIRVEESKNNIKNKINGVINNEK
jgi:uncharacterized protein (UPF0335 family)